MIVYNPYTNGGLKLEAVATPRAEKPLFSNKALKKLIFPLVIEQFLAISVGFCDTVMISGLGYEAISGVSLVDMIMTLMINVFAALATGGAVVAAQFIGAKRVKDARSSASQLIFIALIISLVLMALTLAFKAQLLRLFFSTLDEGVMQSALTYFWISALSFPFIAVYNCCAALFRAMGNSKISMLASLMTNVMNIIGNSLLIYGVKWGVAGAAASSTISRFSAMLLLLILLHKKDNPIYISLKDKFKPDFGLIKRILTIGIPNSVESSLFHLGRILVVSIITSFGTVQIAANAVANNLDGIGCIPGQAMGLAMITVIGQCVGLGSEKQIRLHAKKLMRLTYLMAAVWNAIILVTLPLTLKMYNISPDAYSLALKLIIIHNGCAILIWPAAFTVPNILKSANDVKFTMCVALFSMFTFRLLLSYIIGLKLGMGAIGVWIAMIVDWIFRAAAFCLRYKGKRWLSYSIYKKDSKPAKAE